MPTATTNFSRTLILLLALAGCARQAPEHVEVDAALETPVWAALPTRTQVLPLGGQPHGLGLRLANNPEGDWGLDNEAQSVEDQHWLQPYLEGVASWYGPDFHGKRTANGEVYNQYGLTAAHPVLPMGTKIRVENLNNGRRVWLRVNDRGPYAKGRVVDLSYTAAHRLGMLQEGTAHVRIVVVKWPQSLDTRLGLKAYSQYVVQVAGDSDPALARQKMAQARLLAGDYALWLDHPPQGAYSVVNGPYDSEEEARQMEAEFKQLGLSTLVRSWRK